MRLSIIIPCKNEEKYIGKLLESLAPLPTNTEIIIADAGSTDNTLSIIESFVSKSYPIRIIRGGLPSVGRNNGAKAAKGDTLLFIDADCYLKSSTIITKSLSKIDEGFDLVGAKLNIERNIYVKLFYFVANLASRLSKFDKPFVFGAYFMITKYQFNKLGGFDETLMHCEDYFLSREVYPEDFDIVNECVYTDDRRFKKLGVWGSLKYFMRNLLKRNDKDFFKKDVGYWK